MSELDDGRPETGVDGVIDELLADVRWHVREMQWKNAAVEHLQAMRDGQYLSAADRQDIKDLERAFGRPAKSDRYRRPQRPDVGGDAR
ncbi:hypothetical protein CLV30_1389 [Haloactinopolyspora alba]|uniref:Uncharacterized protein n=1 Tax=Haloactinopolyspora alba TaxID=648780 RepID=A0A2P8D048_9ACTN|nr:hypothetical protein [Haloactinopolyspora alba]PSK90584.1 hypothetical protein CLV30_1389 [Haloactinopolyspora alba]